MYPLDNQTTIDGGEGYGNSGVPSVRNPIEIRVPNMTNIISAKTCEFPPSSAGNATPVRSGVKLYGTHFFRFLEGIDRCTAGSFANASRTQASSQPSLSTRA